MTENTTPGSLTPDTWVAASHSSFFGRVLTRDAQLPGLLERYRAQPLTRADIDALWTDLLATHSSDTVGPQCALRRLRNRVMAILMERDLAGAAPLEEVMGAMTALAELAIRIAYQHAAHTA